MRSVKSLYKNCSAPLIFFDLQKSFYSVAPKKSFQTKLFINGKFVDSISGKTFETTNPANGEVLAKVSEADKLDVDVAVKSARKAFQSWRNSFPTQRRAILNKLADLIDKNADELALLDSLDNGKPFNFAKNVDVSLTTQCFRYYAGWADKIEGSTIPADGDYFVYTRREPLGVCGQIIPWNFPLLMAAWKLAPALATGNTVVMKTAEQTPLSALKLAELMVEAGIPSGVVNILSGFGETAGKALALHPDVDKVAFTGSTEVGKLIQQYSGQSNLKRVSLELGGKSPLIVLKDSDLDHAVETANFGLFFNQGEVCTASSRIFVQDSVYDEFVEKAVKRAKEIKVGPGTEENAFLGPVVSSEQYERVMKYIEYGKSDNAKLAVGGKRIGNKGYFIEPTIFADVKDDMRIAKEEIFGPVMGILKFKSVDEAIKRANTTTYGLAASVVTNDLNKALYVANNLRAGTIWVNCHNVFISYVPFGGYKQSGFGRELGKQCINNYTETKAVIIKSDPYNGDLEF